MEKEVLGRLMEPFRSRLARSIVVEGYLHYRGAGKHWAANAREWGRGHSAKRGQVTDFVFLGYFCFEAADKPVACGSRASLCRLCTILGKEKTNAGLRMEAAGAGL